MLELVSGAPAETFALRASGTVMSRDIEDAIEAALGPSVASTGFVILKSWTFAFPVDRPDAVMLTG